MANSNPDTAPELMLAQHGTTVLITNSQADRYLQQHRVYNQKLQAFRRATDPKTTEDA